MQASQDSNAFSVPDEIKKAVEGIDSPVRWQIMEALVSAGKSSYTNLMSTLEIENTGQLNLHLKPLLRSGLIERTEIIGSQNRERVFYDISPFGKSFISGLLSSLTPPEPTSLYEGLPIAELFGSANISGWIADTSVAAAVTTAPMMRARGRSVGQ